MAKAGGKFSNAAAVAGRFIKASIVFSPAVLREFTSPELARQLAGTSDKKSKEYKAALRNVQRYKDQTRKPKKETIAKIEKAVRELVKKQPKKADVVIGDGAVSLRGRMGYDDKDMRNRTVTAHMSADELGDFLNFARAGELEEAQGFFFETYGAPIFLEDFGAAMLSIESE